MNRRSVRALWAEARRAWWPVSPHQAREVTTHGEIQIATMPCKLHGGGFVAWAKFGPIQAFDPVAEPGTHVWFNFGNTRAEARGKLLDELGLCA